MNTYTHDYTLPAKVNSLIREAYGELLKDSHDKAGKILIDAIEIMDQYLAADNVVLDNDIAYGWVKSIEVVEIIKAERKDAIDNLCKSLQAIKEANEYSREF